MVEKNETRTFGENLKYLRNQQQLTQDMIAKKLGISRQSISNWENDKSFPDLPNLILLSKLYNVSLDNIIKSEVDDVKNLYEKVETQSKFSKFYGVGAFLLIALLIVSVINLNYLPTLLDGIKDIALIAGLYLLTKLKKENIQLPKPINLGITLIYLAVAFAALSEFTQGFLDSIS